MKEEGTALCGFLLGKRRSLKMSKKNEAATYWTELARLWAVELAKPENNQTPVK